MRIQADSLNTVAAARRNGKTQQTLNRPVSVETAFDRAIRVNDGSIYEPVAPSATEPAIDLIEEVGPQGLRNFPVPPCDYHLRVEFSDGTEWFVSFDGQLKEDTDGERCFLEAQLSNFYVDGMPSDPQEVERVLAPQGIEAIEEWLLGDGRAV
jgi:hypothetical protein